MRLALALALLPLALMLAGQSRAPDAAGMNPMPDLRVALGGQ